MTTTDISPTDGHSVPPTASPGGRAALLSATYFGPVQWYQKLHRRRCVVECCDHFVKQTYRNRCVIAAANGPQTLTVPVERTDGGKTPMRDVLISDHGNWRHLHWNALVAAYGETPFFEFYADDLRPYFEHKWKYLLDFDLDITDTVCRLLDVRPDMSLSTSYTDGTDPGYDDFRDAIRPKHPLPDPSFSPQPYYQVRAARHGFLPNLSILDLLMNEGPEGIFRL